VDFNGQLHVAVGLHWEDYPLDVRHVKGSISTLGMPCVFSEVMQFAV
jgi:hypothetical protein